MITVVADRLQIKIDLSAIQPPQPENPIIALPGTEQDFSQAVWTTYDPIKDSLALKKAPETFEQLRSCYPLRREFCAYALQPDSEARKFEAWGFAS